MSKKTHISAKQIAIDKDQAKIVALVSIAAAIVVFSLVSSRALLSKMSHQNRVIVAKQEAAQQLQTNLDELERLKQSYLDFEAESTSILGNDGEQNSKVILDALPSKYDYAALLTSIEGILQRGGYKITEISGVDQELDAQQVSSNPVPIEIPLRVGIVTNYQGAEVFLADLYRSIRPMNIQKIQMAGDDLQLSVYVDFVTYYQPETNLDIGSETIK